MRVVIQRVQEASVSIDKQVYSSINKGLLILLGVENSDRDEDIEWLTKKILNLRVFADDEGVMNRSVVDVDGELLVVSQFTLHARTKKGNRPSYVNAAGPDFAIPMYESFVRALQLGIKKEVKTGKFGANMQVSLVNDGPVTIVIDSKRKE